MKLFGTTKKGKIVELDMVDIVVDSKELNEIAKFVRYAKKQLSVRKNKNYVECLTSEEGLDKIYKYDELVKCNRNIISDHYHYRDYGNQNAFAIPDISINSKFMAVKTSDGGILWEDCFDEQDG